MVEQQQPQVAATTVALERVVQHLVLNTITNHPLDLTNREAEAAFSGNTERRNRGGRRLKPLSAAAA